MGRVKKVLLYWMLKMAYEIKNIFKFTRNIIIIIIRRWRRRKRRIKGKRRKSKKGGGEKEDEDIFVPVKIFY